MIDGHIFDGIDCDAIAPQLKMQVFHLLIVARTAQNGDGLPCLDVVAFLFQKGCIVLIHREIAVSMLDADAIAVVDTPCRKHNGTIQGGIDDFVAIGDDIDAKMPVVGIEGLDDGAVDGDKEILHQRTWFGGWQVVGTEEIIMVLGRIFSTQDAVLLRFLQRDGVEDVLRQRLIDAHRSQSTVSGKVIAFHNLLHVFEIDVLLLQLTMNRVGAETEQVDLTVEVGVGVAWDVFAQGRESDDEDGDDDEQQGDAYDNQNQIQKVEFEIEDRATAFVVRHQEVVSPI